jgi:pyrroloquinoline quinone biosynthesis protein B
VILGVAQDAGFPHLGCFRECCETARREGRREPVAALGLIGERGWWLVDATPDLPEQVHAMGELPRGILLTHAHVGHYAGLMYLGREGMNARGMPVHCSEAMAAFLRENAPWDQLVRLGNVELRPFRTGETLRLDPWLEVQPERVPHRDEYADTHAFGIRLQGCRPALYLPDLDRWEGWDAATLLRRYATLLVDGTFFSADELGGRDMSEIPHPTVTRSLDFLGDLAARGGPREIWFLHFNHSNPLLDPGSSEARAVAARGFRAARTGAQPHLFSHPDAAGWLRVPESAAAW